MSNRMSRRRFLGLSAASMGALLVSRVPGAFAATEAQTSIRPQGLRSPQMPLAAPLPPPPVPNPQIPLPGSMIPQFVDEVPNLLDANHLIVDPGTQIVLTMREQVAQVLPSTMPGYTGTHVWSYLKGDPADPQAQTSRASYLGPVILATRNQPTEIKFINYLGDTGTTNLLAYKYSTDQTLHWADPKGLMLNDMAGYPAPGSDGAKNYAGSIPAVPHLHGGEVPPLLDGGPDAWFTSDGSTVGKGFYSKGWTSGTQNYCIYRYPNSQEGALIWFHDHTLGATRLNVYCGLAGGYLIADPADPILPTLPNLFPLVVQDRMFDTNGEFFFPADSAGGVLWSPNPEHPWWVPEFVGDTIVVNGKAWPKMTVTQERFTFMMINGSNARTYSLFLIDQVSGNFGPPLWVIATDGGYLKAPVKIDPAAAANNVLTIMPGERYWFIVDFAGYGAGTVGPNGKAYSGHWLLRNNAKTPYPAGTAPQGSTVGRVMEFQVVGGAQPNTGFNPATPGITLRGGGGQITDIVSLSNTTVTTKRQVTLNEIHLLPKTVIDPVTGVLTAYVGGPVEILVNNTKWNGKPITGVDSMGMFTKGVRQGFTLDQRLGNYLSELPLEGTTELWEIINMTMDAHPMHLHLVQFQLIARQNYNTNKYPAAYAAAFPAGFDYTTGLNTVGGLWLPAYGPPNDPSKPNAAGALGGNPDVTPFLQGPLMPPLPQESGWKDTIMALPGTVTRLLVRWAPDYVAAGTTGAAAAFPFDPQQDGGGYVWHCHIVDHEDNEMMRPDRVTPASGANRIYIKGTDY